MFSVALIPVGATHNFLDLQYKKLKPNKVELSKVVNITVDESASPLFYKMPEVKKLKSIEFIGKVDIEKEINPKEDDAYFQIGVVYAGDYRPSGFVKSFLPEWLLKVLSLSEKHGVGRIDFHEVSVQGKKLDKKDSIRDIKMKFKTATFLKSDNSFAAKIKLRDEKILGLWFRADGDESKAKFKTILSSFTLEP